MPELHAKYGPSSFNYRALCHAFENRGGTSPAAEEGTLMHAAIEHGVFDALDPEQLRQVKKCVDFLAPLEAAANAVHKEARLEMKLGKHDTFGTADRVIIKNQTAHLVDFKFGRLGVPPAGENLQAMAYAIGVLQRFPNVEDVHAYFLLPRRDEVTSAVFSRHLLDTYIKTLSDLLDQVKRKNPARTPCKACEYCAKLAKCPAVSKDILALSDQAGLPVPKNMDVSSMTPEVIGKFALPFVRIVEQWAKKVKEHAKNLMHEGVEIDGHELATRSAKTKVNGNVNQVWDAIQPTGTLDLDQFMSCCSVSVSQVRKTVRSQVPAAQRDEAEALVLRRLRKAGLISEEPTTEEYIKRK